LKPYTVGYLAFEKKERVKTPCYRRLLDRYFKTARTVIPLLRIIVPWLKHLQWMSII